MANGCTGFAFHIRDAIVQAPVKPMDKTGTACVAVLRFTRDPTVPATNNEAERMLHPLKVQQKIFGSFRSPKGARNHAVLRTGLDTARRQGWNLLWRQCGPHRMNSSSGLKCPEPPCGPERPNRNLNSYLNSY